MLYLDTSLLVTALSSEEQTKQVQTWLHRQNPDRLIISDWVVTEFAAAIAMKTRLGLMTEENRLQTQDWFHRLATESFLCVPVSTPDFRAAALLAARSRTGLRSGDALHLAIAATASATVCTRDQAFAAAGHELGVATVLL